MLGKGKHSSDWTVSSKSSKSMQKPKQKKEQPKEILWFESIGCEKQMEIAIPSRQTADFLTPSMYSFYFLHPASFFLIKSIKRAINKVATFSRFFHPIFLFVVFIFSLSSFWLFHTLRQLCYRAISLKKIFNFSLASFCMKMFVLSTLVNLFAAISQRKGKKI